MTELPTALAYGTITGHLADILRDTPADSEGYAYLTPKAYWLPMPGETPAKIGHIKPVRAYIVDGVFTADVLAGIVWEVRFYIDDQLHRPQPIEVPVTAGETANVVNYIDAEGENIQTVTVTVPLEGVAYKTDLDELAADTDAALTDKQDAASLDADSAALAADDDSDLAAVLSARYVSAVIVKGDGVDYTGVGDSSAAVQAIIAAASAARKDVVFLPGTLKLNTGLGTWDASKHSIVSAGQTVLDLTGLTSGYGLSVIGQDDDGDAFGFRPTMHEMRGLMVTGPSADATIADFAHIGDIANGSMPTFAHMLVLGFRDQWTWGDNVWCSTLFKVTSGRAKRRILSQPATVNTGENLQFIGCTFFSSTNVAGDAVALYVDKAARSDNNFVSCSLDYNDLEFDINSGNTTFTNCHIENRSATKPLGKISYSAGYEYTYVTVIGGKLVATETTSRPHFLEITSGDNAAIDVLNAKWESYGKDSELIKVLAGAGRVGIRGGQIPVGGGKYVQPPTGLNRLHNGTFELGTLGGWAVTDTGAPVIAVSTEQAQAGTYAAKFSGSGGSGTKFLEQSLACEPGQRALFTCDAITSAYTSGDVLMMLFWYSADGTLIREDGFTSGGRINSALPSWTRKGGTAVAPPGAKTVRAAFRAGSLNASAYVDNARLMLT